MSYPVYKITKFGSKAIIDCDNLHKIVWLIGLSPDGATRTELLEWLPAKDAARLRLDALLFEARLCRYISVS